MVNTSSILRSSWPMATKKRKSVRSWEIRRSLNRHRLLKICLTAGFHRRGAGLYRFVCRSVFRAAWRVGADFGRVCHCLRRAVGMPAGKSECICADSVGALLVRRGVWPCFRRADGACGGGRCFLRSVLAAAFPLLFPLPSQRYGGGFRRVPVYPPRPNAVCERWR